MELSHNNLGTGAGYSVLELVKAFENAASRKVPFRIVDRRPGDVAVCYADPSKAKSQLDWVAEKGIDDMCKDSWRWQKDNPNVTKVNLFLSMFSHNETPVGIYTILIGVFKL